MKFHSLFVLVFTCTLGFCIAKQGWLAVPWCFVGSAYGVFTTFNIALPTLYGVPQAIRQVRKYYMRRAVYTAITARLAGYLLVFYALPAIFIIWLLPGTAAAIQHNLALVLSWKAAVLTTLTLPFLFDSRTMYKEEFDDMFGQYYYRKSYRYDK